ncbi:MAG: hypothetical protein JNG82_14170 [Opitutaceae bacterium]|jgi:hypothetical protein|nr:hypothetical protein [Opitutaceae bacterium]
MTLHLACYAAGDRIHFRNQAALIASARRHGVSSILALNADTLRAGFTAAHPALFAKREGAGYWLWKPRIILDALERAAGDDLVVYADAGADLRGPLDALAAAAQGRDGVLFWNDYPNRMHVKRDAFVLTGTDQPCHHDARQLDAAFLVLRNNERVRAFVRLWLEHCTDPRQLTDQPNTCGRPDLPGFVQHRHDQSLLTLIYLRERAGLDFKTLARRLKHRHFRHHRRRASWQPIWLWHAFHDGGEAALHRARRRWRVAFKRLRRRLS